MSSVRNVKSYGVLLERADPTVAGRRVMTRKIILELEPLPRLSPNQLEVAFYENWSGNPGNTSFVSLPMSDFEDFYKMLQTEDPLHVIFTTKDSNSKDLLVFQLSTVKSNEPTGEGPKDRTGG